MPSAGALLLLAIALGYLLMGGAGDDGGGESREGGGRPTAASAADVRVTSVVDGDTIHAIVHGDDESVRYIGIDTPEVDPSIGVECFGEQASARNRELVAGERVRLEFGAERRDHYGRLLAYIYVDEVLVNAEMVSGGYARTLEIEPNTDRAPLLNRLEQEAANAGRGLWGDC
ncbi:MAG: thermonuclease family protein [Solirubrobacterales bacterium]